MSAAASRPKKDLSVTALYTSQVWRWGGLSEADLFDTPQARSVFGAVNGALAISRLLVRGRPSLRHSLLHRHAMIDALWARSGVPQVLELACGLARRGAAATADPEITYVEVDRPHVIDAKRALLARTERGRAILARPNLNLVPGDATMDALDTFVDPSRPTFVIAEGLLMYLSAADQRLLWRRVAELFTRSGGTFVFDLVPACEQPAPGRIARALGFVMRRFTGGHGLVRDARGRADIRAELLAAGFADVETIEPRDVAASFALPHPDARTQQLVFVCRRAAAT